MTVGNVTGDSKDEIIVGDDGHIDIRSVDPPKSSKSGTPIVVPAASSNQCQQ